MAWMPLFEYSRPVYITGQAPVAVAIHGIGGVGKSRLAIEYAWRHLPSIPLAAVTGSNGKSTVTALITEMLNASGVAAAAGSARCSPTPAG